MEGAGGLGHIHSYCAVDQRGHLCIRSIVHALMIAGGAQPAVTLLNSATLLRCMPK